jgi:hypothetical protein
MGMRKDWTAVVLVESEPPPQPTTSTISRAKMIKEPFRIGGILAGLASSRGPIFDPLRAPL